MIVDIEVCNLIVNINTTTKYDFYVGKGSPFGNPFRIGVDGSRDEVIDKYERMLLTSPELLRRVSLLKGKILGCHCAPLRCHAEILIKHANQV